MPKQKVYVTGSRTGRKGSLKFYISEGVNEYGPFDRNQLRRRMSEYNRKEYDVVVDRGLPRGVQEDVRNSLNRR